MKNDQKTKKKKLEIKETKRKKESYFRLYIIYS